jgi:hypothetical protein
MKKAYPRTYKAPTTTIRVPAAMAESVRLYIKLVSDNGGDDPLKKVNEVADAVMRLSADFERATGMSLKASQPKKND